MTARIRFSRLAAGAPALRSRQFRFLATGQFVSNLGDGMYAVALPWYVLSHHGGALLLGTVLAAYGIPRTCLIMPGGQLADRLGPWRVMMGADIGRLVIAAALAAVAASRQPSLVTLAPIAFGLGAGEGLFLPASFSIMPTLVADDALQSGNALLSAGTQLATFAGPALGGAVVAALSSAAGFGLDALSFGVSALTLWRLGVTAGARAVARRSARDASTANASAPGASAPNALAGGAAAPDVSPGEGERQPVAGGFRAFIRHEPVVPLLMAINIAANLGAAGATEVALPLLARGHLHAGAGGYGVLVAGFGLGALIGALAATRLNALRRPAVAAGLIFLAQTPVMLGLPWAPDLAFAWVMLAAWGGLNMSANITTQTAFQRWAPPSLIGRLSGLLLVTSYGMFPVSVALAGFVVHRFGPGSFFVLSAVTMAATLVWALSQQQFRDFGTRPAFDPAARVAEPAAR
jgi:predicted MFS family arabinose efflux permease